jgi:hypothetical protein
LRVSQFACFYLSGTTDNVPLFALGIEASVRRSV